MYIPKVLKIAFTFVCSIFQLKTEFQEITDLKKIHKEFKAFPAPNRGVLKSIEDELKHMQQNELEECTVCLVTYNIFSAEFVLLKCGHEMCRYCFLDPKMKSCPLNCHGQIKEYKTKFEELTIKKKLQKKKHQKGKMKNGNSIMDECEALKYVLQTLTPTGSTKKLVRKEIREYEARMDEQREQHFAVQKLQTIAKVIWKPLNSSRLGRKTKRMARIVINHLGLDSLEWDQIIGGLQLWIHLTLEIELGGEWTEKHTTILINKYAVIIKIVMLKVILHHARCYVARKVFKYVPKKNSGIYSFLYDTLLNVLFLAFDLWKTPKLCENIIWIYCILFERNKVEFITYSGAFRIICVVYIRSYR